MDNPGASCDTQTPRTPSLGQQLTALWPGFPFLGFAMLLAWQMLLSDTSTWISNIDEKGFALVTGSLLVGLQKNLFTVAALVLLTAALLQGHFRKLLDSKYYTFIAGFLGVLGAASVIFSGPYFFAGPNMLDIRGLFSFGGWACGAAYGLLILRSAQLFSRMEPAKVLVYYLIADLAAGLLYSVIMCNDFYAPFEGSPPLSGIVGLFALPVLSALVLGTGLRPATASQKPSDDSAASPDRGFPKLPGGFWKLLATLAVFSLATSFASGWSTELQSLQRIQTDSRLLTLVEMLFDVALLLTAIRFLTRIAFDKIYLFTMVSTALALALYPMLGLNEAAPSLVVEFLACIFNLTVWCLLSYIAFKRSLSPLAVFGLGYGCIALGKAAGWDCSRMLFALRETVNVGLASLGLAIVVLVFLAVVFNARDFSALFSTDNGTEFNLKKMIAHLTRQGQRDGASQAPEGRRGEQPWKAACSKLAQQAGLSAREAQILELLSKNMGAEQIASTLFISTNTVRTHTHNIYAKLDVHSRQELVARVRELRDEAGSQPS